MEDQFIHDPQAPALADYHILEHPPQPTHYPVTKIGVRLPMHLGHGLARTHSPFAYSSCKMESEKVDEHTTKRW